MRTVAEHALRRADHAFNPIRSVRQGILNGATTGLSIPVIRLGIVNGVGWAAAREILAARRGDVPDGSKLSAPQEFPRLHQQRIDVKDIGNRHLSSGRCVHPNQIVDPLHRLGEWFLNQDMESAFERTNRHGHVEMSRRADNAGIEFPVGERLFPIGAPRDMIGVGNFLEQRRIGLTRGELDSSGVLEAAQVTLANAAAANNQN